jgi:hypothetical protein
LINTDKRQIGLFPDILALNLTQRRGVLSVNPQASYVHRKIPKRLAPPDLHSLPALAQRFSPFRSGLVFLLMIFGAAIASGTPEPVRLFGRVLDENGKPVPDIEVKVEAPSGQTKLTYTDAAGAFEYAYETAGQYYVSLNKAGFFRMTRQTIELKGGNSTATFLINHETEIHEQIEVYSTIEGINPQATAHQDFLIAREIRDIPVESTYDLRNSLEVLPEVIKDYSNQLHIAGGRASEAQYLLDGFEIGDPVTGNLSARINVDSVRVAEVNSGRFGAQYGNAGSGVLAVDTTAGDDRWRAGATDFIPGFSADRGIRLSSWYPRLTLSGPLRRERVWFSEAFSLQRTSSLIREQPRHENLVTQWSGDNMLRVQANLNPKNILQVNFLYNQRSASNLGLGPFSPISTTRELQAYRTFVSAKEQVWSGRTFYEAGLAADISHDETLPRGFEPYSVTPNGSAGNYFESLKRQSRRWQGFGSASLSPRDWHGSHDLQFGFNATTKGWTQYSMRNNVEVLRADGSVAQRTVFSGQPQFHLSDTFLGAYAHDSWRFSKLFILQSDLRIDWDSFLQQATPSPRISVNFLPFKNEQSKFTAAWGVYLQPLALSSIGPAYDQQRSDTFYSRTGNSIVGQTTSRFILPDEPLNQARFYTFSAGWEQAIGTKSRAEINFTQRDERLGLAYEKKPANSNMNYFLLQNNRRDTYRSAQISFRHSFSDKTALSCSYTRSSTRTNQVFDYSLDTLVFSPQESGPLAWDAPNRILSSGWMQGIQELFFSYSFEYRSGFPYSRVNEQQQLIGSANSMRFPAFASLNLGVEKRIRVFTLNWAIRLAILNATNNSNYDSVNNNVDSPNFMKLGGGQKRAFNLRVRLIG